MVWSVRQHLLTEKNITKKIRGRRGSHVNRMNVLLYRGNLFRDQENRYKAEPCWQPLYKSQEITLESCSKPEIENIIYETRNKLATLIRGIIKNNIFEAVRSWLGAWKKIQHTEGQPIGKASSTYELLKRRNTKENLLLIKKTHHTSIISLSWFKNAFLLKDVLFSFRVSKTMFLSMGLIYSDKHVANNYLFDMR